MFFTYVLLHLTGLFRTRWSFRIPRRSGKLWKNTTYIIKKKIQNFNISKMQKKKRNPYALKKRVKGQRTLISGGEKDFPIPEKI